MKHTVYRGRKFCNYYEKRTNAQWKKRTIQLCLERCYLMNCQFYMEEKHHVNYDKRSTVG